MMKYIITESQDDYLNRWNKFVLFMKRRDDYINQLIDNIDYNSHELSSVDIRVSNYLDQIAWKFMEHYNLDDSDYEDWIYLFMNDNYREVVKQKLLSYL